MKIYLIGHIKPDLDSIAAPIAYAEFLKKAQRYEAELIPLASGELNKETNFILEKFKVEAPKSIETIQLTSEDAFILVDHNELSQRHTKIPTEQVIEVLDHHKLNVDFTSPLRLDAKPYGSTATLVYEHFKTYGLEPSPEIAKLMLAAILSDTQGLKSSTTTGCDSDYAHELAKNTHLDIDRLTFDLFKAKSDISGLSAHGIVCKDYKVFDFKAKKVFIGQVETVEPDKLLAQKAELLKALEEIKAEEGVGQAYLVITDVLKINSQIMYTTDEEETLIEHAFTTEGHHNIADIGPRMSRKKDIAPVIEEAILKG